jgi:hypothetical protein
MDAAVLIGKLYSLSLLGCALDESCKTPGFERLAILRHAHSLLLKECADEAAAFADNAEYTALKNKLDTVLTDKRTQLINLFDIENMLSMITGG